MSNYRKYIPWASKEHLTEELPENWESMSDHELHEFLENHVCEQYEDYEGSFIFELIDDLARAVYRLIDDEKNKKEKTK